MTTMKNKQRIIEIPEGEIRTIRKEVSFFFFLKENFFGLKGLTIAQTKYTGREPYGGTVCCNLKISEPGTKLHMDPGRKQGWLEGVKRCQTSAWWRFMPDTVK